MDRRNFLRGLLTTTAGGLLVAADTPGVEAFAPKAGGEDIVLSRVVAEGPGEVDLGLLVFDWQGRPIGVIESMEFSSPRIDMTSWGDTYARSVGGLMHGRPT